MLIGIINGEVFFLYKKYSSREELAKAKVWLNPLFNEYHIIVGICRIELWIKKPYLDYIYKGEDN